MSQFTTPFVGELVGPNLWKVVVPFEYHVGTYPSEEIITVPVGFVTNFASIPRIFWPIVSPVDEHGKAAVVHDYCYSIHYASKKICDDIFREGLQVLKVNPVKTFLMYWTVRFFAWPAWWRHRNKENK